MQGSDGLATSSVIAPQPQIPYTYFILADDDADYDERGVSAFSSPSLDGAPQTLTLRFDNFIGSMRVSDIYQGKLCANTQVIVRSCV